MIDSIARKAVDAAFNSLERPFYTERDFVWICHKEIQKNISLNNLQQYQIHYEYPVSGHNEETEKTYYVDLAIVSEQIKKPILVIEFKYEPNHSRLDILPSKFPVVSLNGIFKDLNKIVAIKKTRPEINWLFVLLDEGNHFKDKRELIIEYCKSFNLEVENMIIKSDHE